MSEETQIRKEDLRRSVREYLADRPGLANSPASIRRVLGREFEDLKLDEVKAALVFLESLKQAELIREKLGSSKYYRITATGTLAHERGE